MCETTKIKLSETILLTLTGYYNECPVSDTEYWHVGIRRYDANNPDHDKDTWWTWSIVDAGTFRADVMPGYMAKMVEAALKR